MKESKNYKKLNNKRKRKNNLDFKSNKKQN